MKQPLISLTIFLCLGIIAAQKTPLSLLTAYICGIFFLLLSFLLIKLKPRSNIAIYCLFFFFGAVLLKNSQILSPQHICRRINHTNNTLCTVEGQIKNKPELKGGKVSFIFKTKLIIFKYVAYSCEGDILVTARTGKELAYGEELLLTGNLENLLAGRYNAYLSGKGIYAKMNIGINGFICESGKNSGLPYKRFAFRLKEAIEQILAKQTSRLTFAVLDAMIFGEKTNIPPLVINSMIKSGTLHILVVSGFNVGLVGFILMIFLKLIRIPRKIRFFITLPLLLLYCIMTGASTPVVRATIMALAGMSAYIFKREPDLLNISSFAALSILIFNPSQLFDIGFQLSFASVISIITLFPKLKRLLHLDKIKNKVIGYFFEGCLVSAAAWMGTAGFIAYHFKIIAPITIIANLCIVPLASLLSLCGFSMIFCALILPVLTPSFAQAIETATTLLLKINSFLIQLPGAYFYI